MIPETPEVPDELLRMIGAAEKACREAAAEAAAVVATDPVDLAGYKFAVRAYSHAHLTALYSIARLTQEADAERARTLQMLRVAADLFALPHPQRKGSR